MMTMSMTGLTANYIAVCKLESLFLSLVLCKVKLYRVLKSGT